MNSLRAFRPFFNALDHYAATTTPALWHSPPSSSSLLGALSSAAGYPPVTIEEKGKGYEITADLPGIKKSDLKLSLGDHNTRLILEGKLVLKESASGADDQADTSVEAAEENEGEKAVTKSADQDEKHLLVDERIFKEVFHRAFNFATPLDPKSMKAKLDDGVLKVTVDKSDEDTGVSVIEVQ
ncbi:hypothetical protein BDY24DRAFT_402730 [Mrakia frigida]|uniref:Hsp20/alpha crystallin family protein n=1 Tax=Mrakia frigida TaxID=29902 RepID=UPI003FCBF4BF